MKYLWPKVAIVAIAYGLGALGGWLCSQVPVRPVAQELGAAALGVIIGAVSAVGLTIVLMVVTTSSDEGGLGAVSFGVSETAIIGIPLAIVVALIARWALPETVDAVRIGAVCAAGGALCAVWKTAVSVG